MAITFRHVDPSEADRAYQWHRAFADGNSHIFPRTREHYEELARGWQNWCALDDDELVGLVYYSFDEHDQVWELGGLMVADGQKGRGVGATLMRVALANLLVDLDPLQDQQSVISHVHRDNVAPRNVIEKQLAFAHKGPIQVPSEAVPGLAADADGYVYGELYELKDPETLQALAAWCDAWEGKLLDGTPAHIELRDSMTLDLWARAIRQMASA